MTGLHIGTEITGNNLILSGYLGTGISRTANIHHQMIRLKTNYYGLSDAKVLFCCYNNPLKWTLIK